jgi:16S rRNA (cytidine1402-2'-O)-methyltransferase
MQAMSRSQRTASTAGGETIVLSERREGVPARRESKGTLYVVATPIGHLEDITLRALRILKTVALVAAEDTRRTGNLLRHYDIHTPVLSVHAHNEHARVPKLIARLSAGESIALVTDAGTPGVSDPGAELVAAVRAAGIRVEPIPGASAVIAALSAAGLKTDGFVFLGFAPIKSKARKEWFQTAADLSKSRAVIFFEAPHRLHKTLDELGILVKRPIMAGRELTKLHEELVFGTPGELRALFESPQGEFTLIIPPQEASQEPLSEASDDEIFELFGQITENIEAGSKRDAARGVAERLGLTTKQVYDALERTKLVK